MEHHKARWGKTIAWGAVTAALYAALFTYSDIILHLAHTTPDACVVRNGTETLYFHKLDAAACTAKGGMPEPGTWWHVTLPILLAFAISLAHGAFTGLFWDLMGLKPASRPDGHK